MKVSLLIASISAAIAAILFIADGRSLTGGVWLCASALFGILERQS